MDARKVVCVALFSRVVLCALLAASDFLLPDWDDGDDSVVQFPVPSGLQAFARWDAARFLLIARDGYVDEQAHAHFPGLPMMIRALAPGGARAELLVLVGLVLSNASFVLSAVALHYLSKRLLDRRLAERAVLLYCATPASVFHSTVYTESPFALCTFTGLAMLHDSRPVAAALAFAVGTCFRSNGIVNAGFLAYDATVRAARRRALLPFVFGAATVLLTVLPYVAFEAYGYHKFCLGDSAIIDGTYSRHDWCDKIVPSLYGHVQRTYWSNGLLSFWQLKQLPNFALAAPALSVALGSAVAYLRASWAARRCPRATACGLFGPALLPHVVQTGFLAMVSLLFMNVQVSTRLLSAASPNFHWWLAHASMDRRLSPLIFGYLATYIGLGVLLHPNRLPWT